MPKRKKLSPAQRAEKHERLQNEIAELEQRIEDEVPARGDTTPTTVAFRAMPLSSNTIRGLEKAKFTTPTEIQGACILHALAGRDILGAARTGSGKTLAFLIPVVEMLFRNSYSSADGPGAIILSPTRELAVQSMNVLRQIGQYHSSSLTMGLLMGGQKDFYLEQTRIGSTNIILATPGRLLQHLEQTPDFDTTQVKILVLDEADRILDMGFRSQLERIVDYLPSERQTLLFSATQTKDVKALATLSLNEPEYIGVHDRDQTVTPAGLEQSYVLVPPEHKLNALYSFIKSHLHTKTIVFFATSAQVRHACELISTLRPGVTVTALHGKLQQAKRTQIFADFVKRPHAILLATDVAARGLDFPHIDWVLQVDAPEDRDMYIHRVGRTARYRSGGKALMFLTPAEEEGGFVDSLTKIALKKLSINPSKTMLVTKRAAAAAAANDHVNQLAKKAFTSYVRSVHFMPNKKVFSVKCLPLDELAQSFGLSSTPELDISLQDRQELRAKKNVNRKLQKLKEQIKADKLARKLAKSGGSSEGDGSGKRKQVDVSTHDNGGNNNDDDDDDGDVLVSVGKPNLPDDELPDVRVDEVSGSRKKKKIRIDASNIPNSRVKFDDEGNATTAASSMMRMDSQAVLEIVGKKRDAVKEATDDYVAKVKERLQSNFDDDAEDERERVREKHRSKKSKD